MQDLVVRALWAAIAAVVLSSCAEQQKETDPFFTAIDADTLIGLYRMRGAWTGPEYKLAITGDGRVYYHGILQVGVAGRQSAQVSVDSVRKLLKEFQDIRYFQLANEYPVGDAGDYPTDQASTCTSLRLSGRYKRISCYDPAPNPLHGLPRTIERIAGVERWVAGWNPNAEHRSSE